MFKIIGSDQREYGPVGAEEIRQWLATGRATRQSLARHEGDNEWKPLGMWREFAELPGSSTAAAGVPPAISPAVPAPAGGGINVIIPYRNPLALSAYYLAVFSLIPFIGIVLGILGFVLGIWGLRFHRQNPTAGGKVHAWIGILVGGLFGFGYLALTLFMVYSATTHRRY